MIFGRPLIIATDKEKIPNKIKKIASSFNAKVFNPDHDLTIEEKDRVVNISMKDKHERDALAASLFAFKAHASQFNTIDRTLETLGLERYSNKVKEMIVRKQAKNIAEAIEKVRPKKKRVEKEKPVFEPTKIDWEQRSKNLEKRLREEKNRYDILKAYTEKLESRIKTLEIQKQDYLDEQMRKNEQARKEILKDKEIRKRDILIRQLKFELNKQKSFTQAYEEEHEREQELDDILDEKLLPVIIIEDFTKESVVNANREFDIADKAVWVQNFKFSKTAAKALASIKPKVVIGEADKEIRNILRKSRIIVVDTVKPKTREHYAAVSPKKIEKEMRKIEKKSFMKWLEDYRRR
jgi:predicted RNase H-like nuclease (RuvC/YqgF family)